MNDYYTIKNKYKVIAAKKKAVEYTDRIEDFLAIIIVVLAIIGIFNSLLQSISQF